MMRSRATATPGSGHVAISQRLDTGIREPMTETDATDDAPRSSPALWVGFVDDFPDDLRAWAYRHVLNDDERIRNDRYRHQRDRLLHLTARLMTRTVLSRSEPGVAPQQWRFRPGPHGKPEIVWPEGYVGRLHFNVSHTEGVVVLALAEGSPVGVDVERIDRPSDFEGLARRFFAPEEAEAVAACADENERAALFYRIWTLKEAYVKAIGKGLAHPLDAFWFGPLDLTEPRPQLYLRTEMGDPVHEPAWQARVGHLGPESRWIVSAVASEAAPTDEWATFTYRFETGDSK
jgi:4'-phosphopantetheinyl transferase